MVLYEVVDKDDLPLIVGSLKEVAEYAGVKENAILSAIGHARARGHVSKYKRIVIEDEEEGSLLI